MGLTQLNFAGLNKVEVARARLKEFEPADGYYLAFSGGKDSVVLYDLAVESGVKFDAHYNVTGIDPPELVQFIKHNYPTVKFHLPKQSIWKELLSHGAPRRQGRWCCEVLKEGGGSGRTVLTGIRWQESARRSRRMMYEVCHSDGTKKFLHPIIDFTSNDIWEYIRLNNLPYCSLYDEGFKRLGCVLCPMETPRQTVIAQLRFPKLAEAWHRAIIRYWERGTEGSKRWKSGEEMWEWWLSRKGEPKVDEAQCFMFDD